MLCGVAIMRPGRDLAETLEKALLSVESNGPVAVCATSDYGSLWLTQHSRGEPWTAHFSNGDVRYLSQDADLSPDNEETAETLEKILGSGQWKVVVP